ncbi:MAG: hypothetical protein IT578_07255 [Verrucomicrobiae bacterium]|nr:hypothetical protein [Verrucomicrobiae bacterium]
MALTGGRSPAASRELRDRPQAIRKLADKVGIQFSGLATGPFWGANDASADPKTREKAVHILRREIECAAGLEELD